MNNFVFLLSNSNSPHRTTKNLEVMNSIVTKALNENSCEAISLLSSFLFSIKAQPILQAFGKNVQTLLIAHNLFTEFELAATTDLNLSFWSNHSPTNQNFATISNALLICGNDFVFQNNELNLINKIIKDLSPTIETALNIENNYVSASKIIESFYQYYSDPRPINDESIEDLFSSVIQQTTTYSILATFIIKNISNIPLFDTAFSLIRSLSHLILQLFPNEMILSLFSFNEQNSLYSILVKYMTPCSLILVLSVIARKIKNKDSCNSCFDHLQEMEKSSSISLKDRVFLYNALNQISPFVTNLSSFVNFYGEALLRDFDSSNNLISSALRSIIQTLLKPNKTSEPKEMTESQISERLLTYITPLSFYSKLKTWLLPLLLKYVDSNAIPNEQLIKMAQDPSAGSFVGRCVKSIKCKRKEGVEWSTLIGKCKEAVLEKSHPWNEMIVLRPILQPLFENYPDSIEYAFKTLQIIDIPNKEHNQEIKEQILENKYSNEWIYNAWLMFECLLSTPRSKWKLDNDQIRLLIHLGISSGQWDVRAASFTVFTIGGFPQNEADISFLLANFENLLFFDSPKHVSIVKSAFVDFIERLNNRTKALSDQSASIQKNLYKIICQHMVPSYISSHRQFAFDLATPILRNDPNILFSEGDFGFSCLISLILDSNHSLSNCVISFVNKLYGNCPQFASKIIPYDKISSLLFNEIQNNDEKATESISEIIGQVDHAENWEDQCKLFEQMDQVITKGKVNQNEIIEASDKLFHLLLTTRNLAVTCRGQIALESIAKKIKPLPQLERILDGWIDTLISAINDFDMENMRRSAALPYLALSILRLNTPDIMQAKSSVFEKFVKTILNIITNSTNDEESKTQEATHCLNMIRAILTDKATSPLADIILPSVFESIFLVLENRNNWDLVTAANLCLAAVIRKLKKKNVSQEDDNDTKNAIDFSAKRPKKSRKKKTNEQSILLNQFFIKIPKSKSLIINALQSKSPHLHYLGLLTLSSFSFDNITNETFVDFQKLIYYHLTNSRDSRMRRLAARAIVAITNKVDLMELFGKTIKILSHTSFNELHGQILLLRESIQIGGLDEYFLAETGQSFPPMNFSKIPPFLYDDLFYVFSQIKRVDLIPTGMISFNEFYYDQVSIFLHRPFINQPLGVSEIVALLLHLNASGRVSDIEIDKSEYEPLLFDDFAIPNDLNTQLISYILIPKMMQLNSSLLYTALNFLIENPPPDFTKLNSSLLIALIRENCPPHITTGLIHLLFLSLTASTIEEKLEIVAIYSILEDYVMNLSEDMTPVHVSIAELLPILLEIDQFGKFDSSNAKYKNRGFELALRLLIDDAPKVRTMTILAVSKSLGYGLLSEIVLFNLVKDKLLKETPPILFRLLLKWLQLINKREQIDTHGEALCVLVDEFFIVRALASPLNIDIDLNKNVVDDLLNLRKELSFSIFKTTIDAVEGQYLE